MKQCASCQAEMVENSRFCMKCGTPNPDYRPGGPPAEATVAVTHSGPPTQTLVTGTAGIEKTEMIQDAARATQAGQRTEVIGPAGRTGAIPAAPATLPPQPAAGPTLTPPPAAQAGMVPEAALRTSVPGSKDEISKIFETSGVCPNCYAPLKKGSSQCEECGYRLTGNYCATCGKAIEDGAKFCPNCKTIVPAASPTVTTPSTGATAAMSAATLMSPAAPASGTLGATIVTGQQPPLGATVIAAPPPASGLGATVAVSPASAGLGATAAAGVPAAAPAPPRKGLPVALVLVLGFVLLIVLGVGGWAAWKFLISKKTDTGAGTGTVETTAGTTTTSGGAAGTQPDLTGGSDLSGFGGKAEDLIGEAQQYYNSGDLARALETVERHLQNHKNDSGAYFFAAKICRELGKTEEAKNYLLTALSYNPDNADAHRELGKLYSNAGFSDKAVEQFREAVRLAPDDPEAAWLLAKEFERLGDKENARKAAGQYVQNFPTGQYRAEADAMLAVRSRTTSGRTGTSTGTAPGGETYAGGGATEPLPPPPPPPSPYVDIVLDGTALTLPGMVASVDVMIGGAARKFGPGANMRLDNIAKGSQEYTVRVTYINANTNEQESTYSGSGTIDVRYPNQKVYVKRIGNRVILQ